MQFAPTPPLSTRPNEAWMVNFVVLDFPERPLVRLILDVGTRRPLSATLTLGPDDDFVAALGRLTRRSGRPEELWFDNQFEFCLGAHLRFWAHDQEISIVYCPMQVPARKSISEPILGNLRAHLREKRFATLMELGHEIERWRQSYTPAARTIPEVTR